MIRPTRSTAAILFLYTLAALYLVPIFPHGGSANEQTRWATAASVVEKGSFELSWTAPLLGPIVDTARIDGRVYSNKAPGSALLAVPGYVAARALVGAPGPANIRATWTAMRWLIATVPLIGFAFLLMGRRDDPLTAFVVLFASPMFLYSLLLFSHVLVGVAVYVAYRALFSAPDGPTARAAVLAGAAAGVGVASEFTAAVPVAVLGAAILLRSARPLPARLRTAALFILGGVPFAAGVALYNTALFGSPLEFSYSHEAFEGWARVAGSGLFGISWPTPQNAWLLLLSPARGLFFYAPVLLVALVPLFRVRGGAPYAAKVRLAAILAGTATILGHGAAHGGWAAGPRYLVFVLPLLLEALAEGAGLTSAGFPAGLAVGASTVLCVLPALTFPFAPPEFTFPHPGFWRPLLVSEGWATPTLGALLGLGSGPAALVPVVLAVLAALAIALGPRRRMLALGTAAGMVLALGYVFAPGLKGEDGAARRATIAERFFRPTGRLEVLWAAAHTPAQKQWVEEMQWEAADVAAVAPDNWPYSREPLAREGPTAVQNRVRALREQGKGVEAIEQLRRAREEFPFARCDLTDQLGVLLYLGGQKGAALSELEAVRPLTATGGASGCRRALFHLASLCRELGRPAEAKAAYEEFLARTEDHPDPQVSRDRDAARKALAALGSVPGSR